ncbi:hypothetical protein FNF31_07251 [Cafeteria roenbergensis]|uniref:mannose-6-phosphate isomerase n=1 Tax=Cafeteria roenbergensis TaxID=33653 RepID=A0A5A8CBW5_CAFRO|nr:hypothetical protein FNF31_07251 [Cafeteria roenbergensis]KAA0163054.1 hypothetical protein FNF28_04444 [Cafeteria roenbergensis]
MLPLVGKVQHYAWGKLGSESAVARLQRDGRGVAVDEDEPYAEYWFGTHPNGPSTVKLPEGEMLLHDFLVGRPAALGVSADSESSALPFLFKVLSVNQALSVQAHPNKALAAKLHAARPDIYKDANHKPELALALTPFEALCGFRPLPDIVAGIEGCPELRDLVGDGPLAALTSLCESAGGVSSAGSRSPATPAAAASGASAGSPTGSDGELSSSAAKAALQSAFAAFMASAKDEGLVRDAATALVARLRGEEAAAGSPNRELILRLAEKYPGDIGLFAPFWLNVVTLAPGSAIFLGAGEPHAYLSGDCVECMATSDNVVRAGLTPKLKDVPTLVSMLTYKTGVPAVLRGEALDDCATMFAPPVPEFAVQRITVSATRSTPYQLTEAPSAAVLLCVGGKGEAVVKDSDDERPVTLSAGSVFLETCGASVSVTASEDLLLFRVHTNAAE